MTIAGIVHRPHGVANFSADPLSTYNGGNIAVGDPPGFTAVVGMRVREPGVQGSYYFVAGNADLGSEDPGGWSVTRQGVSGGSIVFFIFLSGQTFELSLSAAEIQDREICFVLVQSATEAKVYFNGGLLSTLTQGPNPSIGDFRIGGDTANDFLSCIDWIDAVAYINSGTTVAEVSEIWDRYRRYGLLDTQLWEYLYYTSNLHPANESIVAPATWTNLGTAAPAGDLTWEGDPGSILLFEDNPTPAWATVGRVFPAQGTFATDTENGTEILSEVASAVQTLNIKPTATGMIRIAWGGNVAYTLPAAGSNGIEFWIEVNAVVLPGSMRRIEQPQGLVGALTINSQPAATEILYPVTQGVSYAITLMMRELVAPDVDNAASVVDNRTFVTYQIS